MVHNGIEYGLMQAYAEGFDILKNKASPALAEGERFDLDLTDIAEVWRRGSVVSSWLLDLTAQALAHDGKLEAFTGDVDDSGEGRWTVEAAIEEAVPADVLTTALYARFRSRQTHTFAEKILSAMRFGFGGHVEPKSGAHRDQPPSPPASPITMKCNPFFGPANAPLPDPGIDQSTAGAAEPPVERRNVVMVQVISVELLLGEWLGGASGPGRQPPRCSPLRRQRPRPRTPLCAWARAWPEAGDPAAKSASICAAAGPWAGRFLCPARQDRAA